MDHPEVKDGEVPFLHNLNKPPLFAQRSGCTKRGEVANSGARKQCSRKARIVVHRKERLEHQRFLFFPFARTKVHVFVGVQNEKARSRCSSKSWVFEAASHFDR